MGAPQSAFLPDGRLHLQHGPIDLIVELFGTAAEVAAGYVQARTRFERLLDGLVAELPRLRTALGEAYPLLCDPIGQAMVRAVWPHREVFVTPMAAVAGAVADAVLAAAVEGRQLTRGYVNNGGDIALFLAEGERFEAGVVGRVDRPQIGATVTIEAAWPVRGLATSGWRGRSHSLGIADAVTVLAENAAAADAAATLIANAVNIDHPAVRRVRASELDADSDLGEQAVTVAVGRLPAVAVQAALLAGVDRARGMQAAGLIHAAYLGLAGAAMTAGVPLQQRLGQGR